MTKPSYLSLINGWYYCPIFVNSPGISSLLTFSVQEMFSIFLQSHISQLSNLRISSFLNPHDSAPYSSVLQMTVLTILFFIGRGWKILLKVLSYLRTHSLLELFSIWCLSCSTRPVLLGFQDELKCVTGLNCLKWFTW